jgi:hypothetical protein
MAKPEWLNKYLRIKPEVEKIFDDLEQFREFCVEFGHVYDERNLYNYHTTAFQDFSRWREGKHVRNRWYFRDDEQRNSRPRDPGYRGNYRHRNNNA